MLPRRVSFFETALNRIMNRVLQFDPGAKAHLTHLDGTWLSLEIIDLNLSFDIFFTKRCVRLQSKTGISTNESKDTKIDPKADTKPEIKTHEVNEKIDTERKPHVRMRAPIAALMAFLRSKNVKEATERGLIMEGDLELANEIQNFVMEFDIDWEEMLSRYTGDIFAHSFFQLVRKAEDKKRHIIENLSFSAGNFLQEEQRLLPTAIEVEQFNHAVDDLRNEVDRLEVSTRLTLAKHAQRLGQKGYQYENNLGKDQK